MATLRINRAKIDSLLGQALKVAIADLDASFTAVIESSLFAWPNFTNRVNGQTVGSPRDIVDTGEFRDSQSYTAINPLLYRFVWAIEYALVILYGYTTRAGNTYAARDWIAETLKQVSFEEIFADAARRFFR
ncbi:MAG: hypothetical protein AAGJ95_11895 [Cyanobacteria bacterium J06554_11]